MLKQYQACADGIQFMEDHYPEGAEACEIMDSVNVPKDMLHFAYQYFPLEDKDIRKYREKCHIDKLSTNIWASEQIEQSEHIVRSCDVSNSHWVEDSIKVSGSTDVVSSHRVDDAKEILDTKNVKNSSKIVHSTNVAESYEVQYSHDIQWSRFITHSNWVEDSMCLYKCERVSDCYCCGFLKGCAHCMFCTNLENKEYYIYNVKVTPAQFERFREQTLHWLEGEAGSMIKIKEDEHGADRYEVSARYDAIFQHLSPEFYGWAGTLPNATDGKFLSLFFREK